MKLLIAVSLVTLLSGSCVKCARILGVFPFAGRSHYMLGHALMKGLAEAGHDVTMISPFKNKEPLTNGSYRDVVLTGVEEYFEQLLPNFQFLDEKGKFFPSLLIQMTNMMYDMNNMALNHSNVRDLLASEEKFDAVIVEHFMCDSMYIFAHLYNAPLIIFFAGAANPWVNSMVGNPSPLAYATQPNTEVSPKVSFVQRVKNTFFYVFMELVRNFYFHPLHNDLVKRNFENPPLISDLYYNVSLMLLNAHESYNQPLPLVPNMVQIGGFHVKPQKKLPPDLEKFIDTAKDGVVYFSMGSTLQSKDLPAAKRDVFLKAFSKLKQKVLWKFEDDVLPGQPSNVKVGKWLPQQDILAHPNVKLFITHGGMLSTTETVYYGVPVLAIPVFADQHMNAQTCVSNGFALSLSYQDPEFSEERLSVLIEELLHNPKYTENVKKISRLFHDRPLKPMENAAYWVKYVIRHKGAPHLRVAGTDLPWYQYLLLDVVAFIALVVVLTSILVWLGIRKCLRFVRTGSKSKTKTKSKTN